MPIPLLIALYVLVPAVAIALAVRFPLVDKIGVVVICYLAGVVLGNVGVLPEGVTGLQDTLTEATVALSLPLLLFSMDVRRWVKVAGKAMLSMFLAVASIVAVATAAFPLLRDVDAGWQVAGMAVGVYTGGTPNVAAIKTALDIDPTLFVTVHSYDLLVGTLYLLFTLTVAQRFFGLFLPAFPAASASAEADDEVDAEGTAAYRDILQPRVLLGLLAAVGVSLLIVGASVLLGDLVPPTYQAAAVILTITTLSLGASFIEPIRRIPKTFALGMYVIYVFCFVVGSLANAALIVDVDPTILGYMAVCIFGTMALHAFFAWLFRVDADTFVITSVAAVCSPPFVPVVAGALRNRTIVLSGLTTGIIGYAVGNYLGITVALALRTFAV